jgi:hypothetical protein
VEACCSVQLFAINLSSDHSSNTSAEFPASEFRGASLHDMQKRQKFMFIAFSQGTWLIALLNTSASA